MIMQFESLFMVISIVVSKVVIVQSYFNNCQIIHDLEYASLSADISAWQVQGKPAGWNSFFTCSTYKMLGGFQLENPTVQKNYTGLCDHDMIFLEFDLFIIDSIDPQDGFRIYIDDTLKLDYTNGSFYGRSGNDLCGNPDFDSETLIRVITKINHSSSLLTLKFDWYTDDGRTRENYGVSNITIHMKQTDGQEQEAFYSRTEYNPSPYLTLLDCPIGQQKSSGQCEPCHSSCSECIDNDKETNCIRCKPDYFFSQQNHCIQCHPFFTKTAQACSFPCSNPTDFLFKGGQCNASCDDLYEQEQFEGKNICKYKCAEGEYLYQDKQCRKSCLAPFKIENITSEYQICVSPCKSDEFYFQNNTCLPACPSNSFRINNKFGIQFCDYKCSNLNHFLHSDESCNDYCNDYENEIYINNIEKLCKTCKKPQIADKGKCVNPPTFLQMQSVMDDVLISTGPSFLLADPTVMWGFMGIMQTLFYLLFLNVNYPQNFKQFLKLFSAGRLKFIPDIIGDPLKNRELESPENFSDNEFSGFFLQSVSSMLTSFIIILLVYGLSKLILRCYGRRLNPLLFKIFKYILNQYEWSGLLRLQIGGYLEFSFGAFLQITALNFTDGIYTFSSILAIVIVIFNIAFPFFIFYLIKKKVKGNQELIPKYQALSDDYDINRTIPKYFVVIIGIGKLVLVLSMVFLYDAPFAQNIFPWFVRMFLFYLMAKHKPHVTSLKNFSNSMSELMLFVIHSLTFALALEKEGKITISHESRDQMGVLMISVALLLLIIQIFFIIREQVLTIKFIIRWYSGRKKKKRILQTQQSKCKKQGNTRTLTKEINFGHLQKGKKMRIRRKQNKNIGTSLVIKN